jgi:hypothetical protein
MTQYMNEVVGAAALPPPERPLKAEEREILWLLFRKVEERWFSDLPGAAASIKPQWLDYLRAMVEEAPSLVGEYENAVGVFNDISSAGQSIDDILFAREVRKLADASTRLDHAKFFVVNPFIRVFVACVGFKAFGGRNYGGYMGGSRFGDEAPVRVGRRL